MIDSTLIGMKEVREHFNVAGVAASRTYIQNLVKKGLLPKPAKIGKKLAWYESAVLESRKNIMNTK